MKQLSVGGQCNARPVLLNWCQRPIKPGEPQATPLLAEKEKLFAEFCIGRPGNLASALVLNHLP